jgi:5'-nucleotidase
LGLDGQLVQAGERIRSAELLDGTPLVTNGAVVEGDPVNIATLDFLSRGGDGYPFAMGGTAFGVSYQQALRDFVAGGLEGEISAARYPAGGLGRIVRQE